MIKEKNYFYNEKLGVKNAFFIKPYDFNITNNENILKKYEEIKSILSLDSIVALNQQHTSIVKKVTIDNVNDYDLADGMITNVEGLGLAVRVADCQAIFLYNPIKKVIGNIHSGWRGTIAHIVKNAIEIMVTDYKCDINNIKVFIAPSIGQCHFEVDLDVYLEFKNSFTFNIDKYTIKKNNKYYIDTREVNREYLISLGILKKNIEISSICTVCNGDTIHSYRHDKENSGRNLAIIAL